MRRCLHAAIYILIGAILTGAAGITAAHLRPELSPPTHAEMFDIDKINLQIRQAPTNAKVVLLGDSLVERWMFRICQLHKSLNGATFANLGVGGSRVSNILWMVNSGKLSEFHPQAFVLMIGTNDLGAPHIKFIERRPPTADQIVAGINMIADSIRQKFPQSNVIVMGLPDDDSFSLVRERKAVNAGLARFKGKFQFCEFESSGHGEKLASLDSVHLNDLGYARWSAALQVCLERDVHP